MNFFVVVLTVLVGVAGCTNHYSKHYQDITDGMSKEVIRKVARSCDKQPEFRFQDMNKQILEDLSEDNYAQVGVTSFTTMKQDKADAITLANEKCANLIFLSIVYERTRSGTNTVNIPTYNTVNNDISGRITGPNGPGYFTGTTSNTVQSYQSVPISYSHDLYLHKAYFFTKIRKNDYGINVKELPEELKEQLNTNRGVVVNSVELTSSAYSAGLRSGDVIKKVNDDFIESVIGFEGALASTSVTNIRFLVIRGTSKFSINIARL